jgi:hypothetical protein
VGGLDPIRGSGSHSRGPVRTRGGLGPNFEVRTVYPGVRQGSDTLPWGSGLTVDTLEYITFSRHVAVLDPPMWWGQVLLLAQISHPRLVESWPGPTYNTFTTRLKIAAWVLRLHTVVRGTLVSG